MKQPTPRRGGARALLLCAATAVLAVAAATVLASGGSDGRRAARGMDRLALAKIAFADRDLRQAEQLLREALAVQPENGEVRAFLGRVLLERGRPSDARTLYAALLKEDAKNVDALRGMAQSLKGLGQFDLALVYWHQAAEIRKDDASIWREMGLAQKEKGDLLGALGSIQQSLSIDPGQSDLSGMLSELASAKLHTGLDSGLPGRPGGAIDPFNPKPIDPESLLPRPRVADPSQLIPRPPNGRLR